jgi:hypothetical protein
VAATPLTTTSGSSTIKPVTSTTVTNQIVVPPSTNPESGLNVIAASASPAPAGGGGSSSAGSGPSTSSGIYVPSPLGAAPQIFQ